MAVFAEMPELLRGLGPRTAAELVQLRAPLIRVGVGAWEAPDKGAECHFGMLITGGVLMRRLSLGGRGGAELLGRGDLIRPWEPQPPVETFSVESGWQALEPVQLAELDSHFARRVARWPQIAAALLERATERSGLLAFQQAASHLPGLGERLAALMWMLADRWGRVTPDGVVVPVRLTHSTLAELVGASRPSVSSTLKALERNGFLNRRGAGWLLHGEPPLSHGEAIGAGRPMARPGRRSRPSHPRQRERRLAARSGR